MEGGKRRESSGSSDIYPATWSDTPTLLQVYICCCNIRQVTLCAIPALRAGINPACERSRFPAVQRSASTQIDEPIFSENLTWISGLLKTIEGLMLRTISSKIFHYMKSLCLTVWICLFVCQSFRAKLKSKFDESKVFKYYRVFQKTIF